MQVGGGLIVISTGWAMLNQKEANGHLRWCSEPCILPANASFDTWSRLHLGCDHFGGECAQHMGANLLVIIAAAIGSAFVAVPFISATATQIGSRAR